MWIVFGVILFVIGLISLGLGNWILGALFGIFGLVAVLWHFTMGVADWTQENILEGKAFDEGDNSSCCPKDYDFNWRGKDSARGH